MANNLLTTQRALLDTLTSFLTVCTHHILFLRNLYPARSFLATRAYNYPVRQNRHPAVCTWINEAIAAIRSQLSKSTVEKVQLCIYDAARQNRVLESWTFDLHSLPAVSPRDQDIPFDSGEGESPLAKPLNVTDLEATFRASLSRITSTAARLKPLSSPPSTTTTTSSDNASNLSFTLTIELRSHADRPVGRLDKHERAWVVAEPESFKQSLNRSSSSSRPITTATTNTSTTTTPPPPPSTGRNRPEINGATTPVRRLEAGELQIEVWVEESPAKFAHATAAASTLRTSEQRPTEMIYGGVTSRPAVRYDPEHGYADVKGTDINKKPDTGRGQM